MKKIFLATAIVGLVLVACTHHKHSKENASDKERQEIPNVIHFNIQQQEKITFATEFPLIEPMGQVIKTTAQIQSSQSDEVMISARIAGIVFTSGVDWTEGRTVNSGQSLFVVSGSGLAENNSNVRFSEAKNNYQKAEADYKRAQELIKEKIISEKDFLQIKTGYETSKAIYDNLLHNFSAQGQKVSAPFSGYIKQVLVENGQFVEEGQVLAVISKNKSLLLKADVQSKYAGLLPSLSSATIRSADKTIYSLEELNGKILSFGKSLNNDSYRIPVSIQMDNRAGFTPGSFVNVWLKTQSEKPVMTIPVSALTEEQGIYFVYVQLSSDSFEKREVRTGLSDGIRTEILSGLNKGEKIVTQGAVSVKLAQSTGTSDTHSGHEH
jgi:RND family efflux transporter MFP subunit